MTKVIGINCHKWLRIISITLWSGFTIGIGYSVYYSYDHTINGDVDHCKAQIDVSNGWYGVCLTQTKWDPTILYLIIAVNVGNVFSMWLVINHKYKFVELKCTTKNTSGLYEWTDGFGHKHLLNANESPKTLPKDWESSE